jgi:peroxiredoxin
MPMVDRPDAPDGPAAAGVARRRRTTLLVLAAVAGASGAGLSWWRSGRQAAARLQAEEAVALFFQQTLPDANGQVFAFEQLRGSQVVVNFWATWCAPCVEEMPELSALATEFQSSGTRFLGVGVDSQEAIGAFSRKLPVSYPLVVASATGAFLAGRFGNSVGGLPYTVVISPSGEIKERVLGRVRIDDLRKVLKS